MFDSIFTSSSSSTTTTLTMTNTAFSLATALILGIASAMVYLYTFKSRNNPQSFTLTLVILPVVIAVIIMLVGNNVARAFSLAGAFSIIRFRSAPGDPKEITYILYTMPVGLAAGMGYIGYAFATAIVLLAVLLIMHVINFGGNTAEDQLLKIVVPEDSYFKNDIEEILSKYTNKYSVKKIKTTELGSLFEINYLIKLKQDTNEKELIDQLRVTNGNLTISMQYNLMADEY